MQNRSSISDLFSKRYKVQEKSLDLSKENLIDQDMVELCNFLNKHPEIQMLDLSDNMISSEEAEILASNINVMIDVKRLYLSSNKTLGAEGEKFIVSMILTNMPKLSSLKIMYCNIGFEGAKALANLVNLNTFTKFEVQYYGYGIDKYGADEYLTKAFSEKRKIVPSLLKLCLFKVRSIKQTNPLCSNKLPLELVTKINKPLF